MNYDNFVITLDSLSPVSSLNIESFKYMLTPNEDINEVYLLFNHNTGLYKIGVTGDVKRRIRQVELSSGCQISLIQSCMMVDEEAKSFERSLHNSFKEYKVIGEWYSLCVPFVESICGLFDEYEI